MHKREIKIEQEVHKFLPPFPSQFHACACTTQFLLYIFLLSPAELAWSQVIK
jgi:hypothetical protein